MKIHNILATKYPASSDMYRKVTSTKVCMSYDELVSQKFPEVSFSKAKHIKQGVLAVVVNSHSQASQVKLYEFDLLQALNASVDDDQYKVIRLRIDIEYI